MQAIEIPKMPARLARFRNSKGFSLIEMAIVLVIIGIIIGAILKGQDLILNSRAKQITAAVTTYRNLAAAYLDRNGRLPGDFDKSGVVGDTEITAPVNAITELEFAMTNIPKNPVIVGGMSFYVYFGAMTVVVGPPVQNRNIIAVCKDAACATVFTADELEVIKTIDTAVDGIADAGRGQFRAAIATTGPGVGAILQGGLAATAGGRAEDVVLSTSVPIVLTAAGTKTDWTTATHVAAFWSFDRPI